MQVVSVGVRFSSKRNSKLRFNARTLKWLSLCLQTKACKQLWTVSLILPNASFTLSNMFTLESNDVLVLFRSRPHYAGGIWKRYFLRLGLPSTQICYDNRAFRKCSSNLRNLETSFTQTHSKWPVIVAFLTPYCPRGLPLTSKIVWR